MDDIREALPNGHIAQPDVHVEVCKYPSSAARSSLVKEHVLALLKQRKVTYRDFQLFEFEDPFLQENVKSISICDTELVPQERKVMNLCGSHVKIHIFQLQEDGPGTEELEEDLAAANHWILPSTDFHGLWESLVFDEDIKGQLLSYVRTALLFSDNKVDSNLISWNRVVLLHGPPGTGKTSLCRALAQKLCIRMTDRYTYGQLLEINSHSLFSKWFSESGKLVMKMFQKIQELIDDRDALVCVLIDEVESLTTARKSAISGSDPSDAIRVVNALLTQIDQIKKFPNVIILTTSNVTGAIDLAFVDRADIKQYIGPPSASAVFSIFMSCINELMKAGIISPVQQLFDLRSLEVMRFTENDATRPSLQLHNIAIKSEGLSGRTLRKLPFIAQAMYLQSSPSTLEEFLLALLRAVDRQFAERESLGKD